MNEIFDPGKKIDFEALDYLYTALEQENFVHRLTELSLFGISDYTFQKRALEIATAIIQSAKMDPQKHIRVKYLSDNHLQAKEQWELSSLAYKLTLIGASANSEELAKRLIHKLITL